MSRTAPLRLPANIDAAAGRHQPVLPDRKARGREDGEHRSRTVVIVFRACFADDKIDHVQYSSHRTSELCISTTWVVANLRRLQLAQSRLFSWGPRLTICVGKWRQMGSPVLQRLVEPRALWRGRNQQHPQTPI
jgi:hypothetical protein